MLIIIKLNRVGGNHANGHRRGRRNLGLLAGVGGTGNGKKRNDGRGKQELVHRRSPLNDGFQNLVRYRD
jgi:hypothetical protein